MKPIFNFLKICMDGFLLILTFWTTLAPRVLFLQILCEILFKNILQIVKGVWVRVKEAFLRFEVFSPCFKCFSFDLTKTPPQWNPPLSVQEGFSYTNFEIWSTFYTKRKLLLKLFKNWWWCGPFALGLIFLPLWHESPKTETFESPFTFSPMVNK
jgi:hypothetical protein